MGFTSPERRCPLKANKAGKPAELTAYEEGATTDASSYLVYRTHPDRSIEVYRQADLGSDKDGSWRWRRCESMTADGGPRVFTLNGCSQETAP